MPTATTRAVFDFVNGTDGKPVKGVTVNCVLNFNGASVTSPIVNVGPTQQSTVTDGTGQWTLNLIPNDTLTPSGTLYTIQTPFNTYDISVPTGVGSVQSSTILANVPSVLSPAVTGLTGPITVTGNETVTGNLTVSGTTTLGSTTTTALTTGAQTVGGDLTISSAFRLLFGAAAAKIVPGATSISHRNNADTADNLLITDAGATTVRNGFTLTAGDAVVTAGRLLVSAAAAKILGGVTSLSLRNNADTADNLLLTDAGNVTIRGTVQASNFNTNFHAEAYLAANFSIPNNTTSVIPFDTIEADPNSNFTTGAAAKYTCPVTGRYLVLSAVDFNVTATVAVEHDVFKNGVLYKRVFGGITGAGTSFTEAGAATVVRANATDTIDIRGLQAQGGAATVVGTSSTTWVQITYLGPL